MVQNTHAYLEQQVQQLKEVRKMLITDDDDSEQKLLLIDAIQRLGVAYHLESEIDEALQLVFDGYVISAEEDDDAYTAALRLRLLRQQGYNVSCGESFPSYLQFSQNYDTLPLVIMRRNLIHMQYLGIRMNIIYKFETPSYVVCCEVDAYSTSSKIVRETSRNPSAAMCGGC